MDAGPQKRTWLAPEARMRRLSVHGKSPEPPFPTASRSSEAKSSSATRDTPKTRKGRQLESPNTPFDGDQEFSHTTSGAGRSLQSPSEVDSGSHEKRHSTISRKLSLMPKARLNPENHAPFQDEQAVLPFRPTTSLSHGAQEQEPKQGTRTRPASVPIPQRPTSQPVHAGGSGRSPLNSARGELASVLQESRPEGDLQQRAHFSAEPGDERRKAGWVQNDTYGVEAAAAVPGWKRPSIAVPAYSESSASRHLSPSGAASSMPWPAISPKEAVTAEQEAWYIEQVAVALRGRERAVVTIQALLRSCKAKTVSSAAAMHQVASLLSGHPILIEGFTAFLPDKTAFFQLDGQSAGPAHPLKAPFRDVPSAEGMPLMPGAHTKSSTTPTEQPRTDRPARRAKAQAQRTRRGGGCLGCGCWQHIKAARTAGLHLPWWTMAFSVASLGVFLYMAGNYGTFHLVQLSLMAPDQEPTESPEERAQLLGFTPAALRAWFRAVPGWRSFDGAYLVAWGARHQPDLASSRWWLWVTSGLLHTDFMHLAGSLLPWAVLACLLELNYGSVRVVIVWLVALLGGAFTSAVLDPPCQVVVGCNGALMGMLPWLFGAFLADFRAITWSWLQLPLAVAAILVHLIIAILQRDAPYHSNWADLGGFLCGLLPAVLFLPCPSDTRWATAKKLLSGAERRCMLCCCCCDGGRTQRAASAEVALADMTPAREEQQPLQETAPVAAMQGQGTLHSAQGAGDVSLDMQRFYRKHQLPVLSYYDKSLRNQWDVEQALAPCSARAESIPAHREGGLPSRSPAVQHMETRSCQASPQEGPSLVGSSAETALRSSADPANAGRQTDQVQGQGDDAGEVTARAELREVTRSCCCCGCCTWADLAHGAFCLFSAVAFFGILVGAPVYLYLVKLPGLACSAVG